MSHFRPLMHRSHSMAHMAVWDLWINRDTRTNYSLYGQFVRHWVRMTYKPLSDLHIRRSRQTAHAFVSDLCEPMKSSTGQLFSVNDLYVDLSPLPTNEETRINSSLYGLLVRHWVRTTNKPLSDLYVRHWVRMTSTNQWREYTDQSFGENDVQSIIGPPHTSVRDLWLPRIE